MDAGHLVGLERISDGEFLAIVERVVEPGKAVHERSRGGGVESEESPEERERGMIAGRGEGRRWW